MRHHTHKRNKKSQHTRVQIIKLSCPRKYPISNQAEKGLQVTQWQGCLVAHDMSQVITA